MAMESGPSPHRGRMVRMDLHSAANVVNQTTFVLLGLSVGRFACDSRWNTVKAR